MSRIFAAAFALAVLAVPVAQAKIPATPCNIITNGDASQLAVGGAQIKVRIDAQKPDSDVVLNWVCNAAVAVSIYYGHFPVTQAGVDVRSRGRGGIGGTTWGGHPDVAGAYSRMMLGESTTADDLYSDWTMTHEFTHMAFPQLPENQHWAEEGMATYLEPIERVQAGQLPAEKVWHDIYRDMKQGEPDLKDKGLNNTHTWARTYWGGAMFWFAADVAIYNKTGGRKNLRDAMRAIVNAGGNIEREGSLQDELAIGDRATGTTVLMDAYRAQADQPQAVDLDGIWKAIGVNADGSLNDHAPLAGFRTRVMQP
jgi:hypothetical protein